MSVFKLGRVILRSPVMLAPMAGVTDRSFRAICKRHGADFLFTEMISAKGMFYSDKKTGALALADKDCMPYAVQIFGSEPEIMAIAARRLCTGDYEGGENNPPPDCIDINMGCPVRKIVANNEGSALLNNLPLAGEIISAVKAAVTVPVTVKIRTGFDEQNKNAVAFAENAEKNGASMITVHGRTREGMYFSPVDYETIAAVKRAVSVPVIGNGGIFSANDALRMFEKTGCDGIAIARGAEGNPFIFDEIKAMQRGESYTPPSVSERIDAALLHCEMLVADKGEYTGVREGRKHIAWYLRGMPDSAAIRAGCNYVETLDDIYKLLKKSK